MKRILYKLLLVGVYALFNSLLSYGQHFALEQDFSKPIPLPDAVYKILLRNKDINETIDQERDKGTSIKSIKSRFFDVTKVNVSDQKFPDLLVKAKSLLSGMNTTRYWIFRKKSKGYGLVFKTTSFSLSILRNRSKGYRIVKISSISGSKVIIGYYRFDGKSYVYSWGKTDDI